MKVNHSGHSPVQSTETSGAKHAGKTQKAAQGQAGGKASAVADDSAKTEISGRGKEFARVKQAATDAPDVREEKIAELKRRIAADGYKIDSHAVADRMVDEHLKMSGIG